MIGAAEGVAGSEGNGARAETAAVAEVGVDKLDGVEDVSKAGAGIRP